MDTLLLATDTWDLVLDVSGNIAVATNPYALAQDAASAIKTFQGEVYFDTTLGVPYWNGILEESPNLSVIRSAFITAALTVPGVVAAQVFFSSFAGRTLSGQVQVTDNVGNITAASF